LEALNKKDITEIKSYGKPPPLVEKCLEAVMILRGNEPTWAEAKRQLGPHVYLMMLFYETCYMLSVVFIPFEITCIKYYLTHPYL